jgi:hypothetical protein
MVKKAPRDGFGAQMQRRETHWGLRAKELDNGCGTQTNRQSQEPKDLSS